MTTDSEIYATDLYDYLPQSNCRRCGEAGCMAFADKLMHGEARLSSCAPLRLPEHASDRKALEALIDR